MQIRLVTSLHNNTEANDHSVKHELLDNVTSSIHLIQMKKSKIFNQKSESEIILDWYLVKNYWSKNT